MAEERDYYEVLGIGREAKAEEIKAAFRKLASLHHPDKNPNDPRAAIRFKEINASYQVLSNPQRRAMYDRFGHRAEDPGSPFSSTGPFAGGVVDISDLHFDGLLGDLLGVFGVGRGSDRGNIKHELQLTFEEAAFGCEKEIRYERNVTCSDCRGIGSAPGTIPDSCAACMGRGRIRFQQGILPIAVERTCSRCRGTGKIVSHPCRRCRGSGLMASTHVVSVSIPEGVEPGATRIVTGAGNRPRPDRATGDLEIAISVKPHPFFHRQGEDVTCQVPITFTQAALGAEVEVPTLEGKGRVRVPPGTQSGMLLRLKGKGIPKRTGIGRGDQRIEVVLEVPTSLTSKQRALLEELAKELDGQVQPQRKTFAEKLRELFG